MCFCNKLQRVVRGRRHAAARALLTPQALVDPDVSPSLAARKTRIESRGDDNRVDGDFKMRMKKLTRGCTHYKLHEVVLVQTNVGLLYPYMPTRSFRVAFKDPLSTNCGGITPYIWLMIKQLLCSHSNDYLSISVRRCGEDFRNCMTLVLPYAISIISNDPSGSFLHHPQNVGS